MHRKVWMVVGIVGSALLLPWPASLADEAGQAASGRFRNLESGGGCTRETAVLADEVSLDANGFSPACILVEKGEEILFSNEDSALHTVSSDPGLPTQSTWLESGLMQPQSGISYTFYERGVFGVHCRIHPNERATIIVE